MSINYQKEQYRQLISDLNGVLSVKELLDTFANRAFHISRSSSVIVALNNDDGTYSYRTAKGIGLTSLYNKTYALDSDFVGEVIRTGVHWSHCGNNKHSHDGDIVLELLSTSRICCIPITVDDESIGAVVMATKEGDVYDSKAIESLKESFDALGRYILTARKFELMTRALESTEQSELLNIQKTEHLARISHEFRTPLNGILAITDLLRETELDAKQKYYIMSLEGSGRTLQRMVEQVLDYSKLEMAQSNTIREEPLNFVQLISQITNSVYPQAYNKNTYLKTVFASSIPESLLSDQSALEHIFLNIIGNCVEYTDTGGIKVIVSFEQEPSGDRGQLQVRVIDTGIGMSEAFKDKMFKAFKQEKQEISSNRGSIGLGMAITKRYIELLGGNIKVKSKQGIGTEFYVSIPMQSVPVNTRPVRPICVKVLQNDLLYSKLNAIKYDNRLLEEVSIDQCEKLSSDTEDINHLYIMDSTGLDPDKGQDTKLLFAVTDASESLSGLMVSITPGSQEYYLKNLIDLVPFKHIYLVERGETKRLIEAISAYSGIHKRENWSKGILLSQERRRALIAEDNYVNQMVAEKFLQECNFDCDVVNNGSDAAAMIETRKYDLLVLDIQMPGLGGIDVLKTYKKSELNHNSKVVMLTADARNETKDKCLMLGIDLYVQKPIDSGFVQQIGELFSTNHEVESTEEGENIDTYLSLFPAEIFDLDKLRTYMMSSADFVRKLVTVYTEESRTMVDQLELASQSGDADECRRIAHKLRSASKHITIYVFEEALNEIEYQERDLAVLLKVTNFIVYFHRIYGAIEQIVSKWPGVDDETAANC